MGGCCLECKRRTVEALPADVAEVVEDASHLEEEDADDLRAARHLDVEQLLHRHRVPVLLRHHRHVVEPVKVRERLLVGLVLDELLGPAMKQPDVRVGLDDVLAAQLEHQPQHAVRRRVLRPEVEREVPDLKVFLADERTLHVLALVRLLEHHHRLRRMLHSAAQDCPRRRAERGRSYPLHRSWSAAQRPHGGLSPSRRSALTLGVLITEPNFTRATPHPALPPVRPASRVLERRELLVHRRRRRRLRLRRLVIGLPRSHAGLGRGGVRAVGLVERLAL